MNPHVSESGIRDVSFGENVRIVAPVNIYNCFVGNNCFIGPFVEIQKGVRIGDNTKIQSHAFICELVEIGADCFIGHGVAFINDLFAHGGPARGDRSLYRNTRIQDHVSIGSNATILPVEICSHVVIGAGSVVTKNIDEPGIYAGNPARLIRSIKPKNSPMMKIPFVDLQAQYHSIKKEIDDAIASVIAETSFIGGPYVKNFEQQFAEHHQIKNCMSCANGTDSIEILLKAQGIGEGDEVIVPATSWISTSEAVSAIGARPVFVDVERDYYNIDPSKIAEKINSKTKAIIPVHLYGHPANMPAIIKIASERKLIVIEDCAQAHNASIASKRTGLWGSSASYSFFPGKNLGAYGDAGCMITDNDELAIKCRMIANHGQLKKHDHVIEGRNSRLDALQASILSAKLKHLDRWTDMRIANAGSYDKLLKGASVTLPMVRPGSRHVFHLYVIRTKHREEVSEYLHENGISTAVHYPTALPLLKAYGSYGYKPSDFPVASTIQNEILSLPLYPELTYQQMEYVAGHLLKVTSRLNGQ